MMKKNIAAFLVAVCVLAYGSKAYADACSKALVGPFVPAQARALCNSTLITSGDVNFLPGKTISIQEGTAASACSGMLTANGATPVVVPTTCALTGSRLFLSRSSAETGVVNAWFSSLSNGVSFSITGEAGDTGTYQWLLTHEAP